MDPKVTRKLVYGAVVAGGSLGLMHVLYNLVRSNMRSADAAGKIPQAIKDLEEGSGDSGQVIQITVPKRKEAVLFDAVMAASAGVGAYYIPVALQRVFEKRRLRKEIENAEARYLEGLVAEEEEEPGEDLSKRGSWAKEFVSDLFSDILGISALMGGVGSYALLERLYPGPKKNPKVRPKKVVIKGYGTVHADQPGDGPWALDKQRRKEEEEELRSGTSPEGFSEVDPGYLKAASGGDIEFDLADSDYWNGLENTSMLVLHVPSVMDHSGLPGIAGAAIEDRQALSKLARCVPVEALAELCGKNAPVFYRAPAPVKRAAVAWLCREPLLKQAWAAMTCGELQECFPTTMEVAARVNDANKVMLVKLASLWSDVTRAADMGWEGEKVKTASDPGWSVPFLDSFRETATLNVDPGETGAESDKEDTADSALSGSKKDPVDMFFSGEKCQVI